MVCLLISANSLTTVSASICPATSWIDGRTSSTGMEGLSAAEKLHFDFRGRSLVGLLRLAARDDSATLTVTLPPTEVGPASGGSSRNLVLRRSCADVNSDATKGLTPSHRRWRRTAHRGPAILAVKFEAQRGRDQTVVDNRALSARRKVLYLVSRMDQLFAWPVDFVVASQMHVVAFPQSWGDRRGAACLKDVKEGDQRSVGVFLD